MSRLDDLFEAALRRPLDPTVFRGGSREALTAPRPGDSFPNVGYVRGFLGREVYAEAPPLPRLIGLSGKKRAGKDTFAGGLIARGATRVAFADNVRAAALRLDPLIGRPSFPNVLVPASDVRLSTYVSAVGWEKAKECPEVRRTLQVLGSDVVRALDSEIWVRAGMAQAAEIDGPVVVTDVRFPNEAEAISEAGGLVVRIDRPGLDTSDEHPSETALDDYPFDLVVVNDKSAEVLFETARTLAF